MGSFAQAYSEHLAKFSADELQLYYLSGTGPSSFFRFLFVFDFIENEKKSLYSYDCTNRHLFCTSKKCAYFQHNERDLKC